MSWNCPRCSFCVSSAFDHCTMCELRRGNVAGSKNGSSAQGKVSSSWSCKRCTFDNETNESVCSMCGYESVTPIIVLSDNDDVIKNERELSSSNTSWIQSSDGASEPTYETQSLQGVIGCMSCTFGILELIKQIDVLSHQMYLCETQNNQTHAAVDPEKDPSASKRRRLSLPATAVQKKNRSNNVSYTLCSPPCVFVSQRGSAGSNWTCGYRNIQMLCSALMRLPEYRRVLFRGDGAVPEVAEVQAAIERAWAAGYDPEGARQLGGRLVHRNTWIGATGE
jgi:hypothetical protein